MTKEEMTKLIKNMLGFPTVPLYVKDEQIHQCIDTAILTCKDHMLVYRYKSYGVGRTKDGNVIPAYAYKVDLSELEFTTITDVYRGDNISPFLFDDFYLLNYAARGIPSSLALACGAISNAESLINRSWKVIGKTLYLDKFYSAITVEFVPKVIGLDDIDDDSWISWIQRYATALVKEVEASIMGKFIVDSNPFKPDTDRLLQEASDTKAALMEEIKDRGYLKIVRT